MQSGEPVRQGKLVFEDVPEPLRAALTPHFRELLDQEERVSELIVRVHSDHAQLALELRLAAGGSRRGTLVPEDLVVHRRRSAADVLAELLGSEASPA